MDSDKYARQIEGFDSFCLPDPLSSPFSGMKPQKAPEMGQFCELFSNVKGGGGDDPGRYVGYTDEFRSGARTEACFDKGVCWGKKAEG